ncbi:MAG: hypothetical protein IT531_00155 [Burkholderiales bacterium]|nr:hypothetical protein [Burkholderiales bacterium]
MPLDAENAEIQAEQSQVAVETPAASEQPAAPSTMLEAIEGELDAEQKPEGEQPAKEAQQPQAEPPEAGADPKAKKDDAAKMPEGLAPEAQKRFQHLIGEIKTERQARETAEATVTGLRQLMEQTYTSAEDFGALLEYNRLCKTGQWDQARALILDQLKWISIHQGKPAPGVDLLAEHPDLAEEVRSMRLSEERAFEIARGRAVERTRQQAEQRTLQTQAQQQQRAGQVNEAVKAVDAWAAKMAASDVDWPAKEKLLDAKMEWLAQNVAPAGWLAHLQQWYGLIASPPAGAAPAKPRPLTSGNGPSGVKPAPQSMREAIEQQLGYV